MTHYTEILLTQRADNGPIGPHFFNMVKKGIPYAGLGQILVKQTHM